MLCRIGVVGLYFKNHLTFSGKCEHLYPSNGVLCPLSARVQLKLLVEYHSNYQLNDTFAFDIVLPHL